MKHFIIRAGDCYYLITVLAVGISAVLSYDYLKPRVKLFLRHFFNKPNLTTSISQMDHILRLASFSVNRNRKNSKMML